MCAGFAGGAEDCCPVVFTERQERRWYSVVWVRLLFLCFYVEYICCVDMPYAVSIPALDVRNDCTRATSK